MGRCRVIICLFRNSYGVSVVFRHVDQAPAEGFSSCRLLAKDIRLKCSRSRYLSSVA